MSGWGGMPWGLGPWGGVGSDLSIANTYAVGDRLVQVVLTKKPFEGGPDDPGSVFNPKVWVVAKVDPAFTMHVLHVESAGQYAYRLVLLEALGSQNLAHTVSCPTLRASAGGTLASEELAEFQGTLAEEARRRVSNQPRVRFGTFDLMNREVPGLGEIGGTLVIDSSGDYARMTGVPLVKKLIVRRLITTPMEFRHLPRYGCGLRVKEPLPGGDLVKLKKTVESQILLEREVEKCAVQLSQSRDLLMVAIQARLRKTGESLDMNVRISPRGVTF